jgi:hypothetical protein
MPYVTLSDQIKKLHNAQRSDAFVKQLRVSVREGDITAADLPARFELPKQYARRGSNTTHTRTVKDMVIDATPDFEAWFENVNKELSPARSGGKIKVSAESIEAGLVDFQALAAETRKKMSASFSKGQALGKSRAGTGTTKAAVKKPAAKRK